MNNGAQIGMPGGAKGGKSKEEMEAEQRAEQESMKNQILNQILDQHALARLNTLRVAKPERAAMIESILINMMRSGQLGGKISEDEFVSLLNRVPTTESSSIKVSFDRRNDLSDDEDYMKDL